jgi:uncharacterized phage-associated protein
MATALDVSRYFLCLVDPDAGDLISNLKLQKLVYYSQGFHLAMYGKVLFDEDILAWEHGPVVESLYHIYKDYGANAIPLPEGFNDSVLTDTEKSLLKEVYEVYGQFSAWKLRNMTHSERPWIETMKNQPIDRALMESYFKDFVTQ